MLRELLKFRFGCPVCGRILYYPLKGYWCPYCGVNLTSQNQAQEVDLKDRLTARDEKGVPYYCGIHTVRSKTYAQDIGLTAIAEVLEKLCQYEELDDGN